MDMLDNPLGNIQRLTASIAARAEALQHIAEDWEAHRVPALAAIRVSVRCRGGGDEIVAMQAELDAISSTEVQVAYLETAITSRRAELGELSAAIATREAQAVAMAADYAKLQEQQAAAATVAASGEEPVVTRPVYTRRILDIIRQIRKQKAEIGRIVKDVRAVQVRGLLDSAYRQARCLHVFSITEDFSINIAGA